MTASTGAGFFALVGSFSLLLMVCGTVVSAFMAGAAWLQLLKAKKELRARARTARQPRR